MSKVTLKKLTFGNYEKVLQLISEVIFIEN